MGTSTVGSGCRPAASPSARWALGGIWRHGRPAVPGGRPGRRRADGPMATCKEGPSHLLWKVHIFCGCCSGRWTHLEAQLALSRGLWGRLQGHQHGAWRTVGTELCLATPPGWRDGVVEYHLCPRPAATPEPSRPPGFQPSSGTGLHGRRQT